MQRQQTQRKQAALAAQERASRDPIGSSSDARSRTTVARVPALLLPLPLLWRAIARERERGVSGDAGISLSTVAASAADESLSLSSCSSLFPRFSHSLAPSSSPLDSLLIVVSPSRLSSLSRSFVSCSPLVKLFSVSH